MEGSEMSKSDMNPALGQGGSLGYQDNQTRLDTVGTGGKNISKSGVKRERAASAARRSRIKKILVWIAVCAAVAIVIWAVAGYVRRSQKDLPGQSYAGQGQQHVALDYQFDYNSNPPTSGPHFRSPANWGVYDYEVNDKIFIHNMEHGGIWISYRPGVASSTVQALKDIVSEFGGSKIVMAPRSANDTDVAVAAWTRLLKLNLTGGVLSDDQKNQIRAFYRAYKNHGPEFVPDEMPGVDPKAFNKKIDSTR